MSWDPHSTERGFKGSTVAITMIRNTRIKIFPHTQSSMAGRGSAVATGSPWLLFNHWRLGVVPITRLRVVAKSAEFAGAASPAVAG